jgi:fibronectin type 3 domain-containing protein
MRLNPALLANPDYLDTTVMAGQTYYYAVTAVSALAESARSPEVVAVIPSP